VNEPKRQVQESTYQKDPEDISAHLFGDLELNRSQSNPEDRYSRVYTAIETVDASKIGETVWVRARVHAVTGKGKIAFVILRQQFSTIQATTSVSDTISKGMIKYMQKLPKESIVDVKATVVEAQVAKTT
jgi:lysyl-tRNA synthetase class II